MPEQKPYPQKMNCLWKGFLPIFKGSFFGHGKTAIFGLVPPKIQYKPQPLWENTTLAKHSESHNLRSNVPLQKISQLADRVSSL